jgi:hypothetical protein
MILLIVLQLAVIVCFRIPRTNPTDASLNVHLSSKNSPKIFSHILHEARLPLSKSRVSHMGRNCSVGLPGTRAHDFRDIHARNSEGVRQSVTIFLHTGSPLFLLHAWTTSPHCCVSFCRTGLVFPLP